MSSLQTLDRRIGFVHVALAFVAAAASVAAIRLWAIPRIGALAEDKAYFAERKVEVLFDGRPRGYSFEEAGMHLEALGRDAREFYASWYVPVFDLAFPVTLLLFGVLFCLWMTQPKRAFAAALRPSWRLAILLIPLALFVFDILENISVWTMLRSYPNQTYALVTTASTFSQIKWAAVYGSWALAAGLIVLATLRWLRRG